MNSATRVFDFAWGIAFVINIIGVGLGPTAVAAATQYLFGRDEAVNYALAIVTAGGSMLSALMLWAGLRPFLHSVDRLKREAIRGGWEHRQECRCYQTGKNACATRTG